MTDNQDKIKAIGALPISATAKYVGILMLVHSIGSAKALVEATGLPKSTVYRAMTELAAAADDSLTFPTSEIPTVPTRPASGKTETEIPASGTSGNGPSRAYMESPSEIHSSEGKLDSPSSVPPKPKRSQARGARLPDDWILPGPWAEWVRVNFPTVAEPEITREADSFRDYWIAKPGAQACKLDWEATWRNWCRKSLSSAGRHRGGPAQPQHTAHWKDKVRAERAEWVRLFNGGVQ